MARAAPPSARRAVPAANIAAAGGYSGRGRRPVAATPSARLFSEHRLQRAHFLRANIADVNARAPSFSLSRRDSRRWRWNVFQSYGWANAARRSSRWFAQKRGTLWKGVAGKLIGVTESLRCIGLIEFNLYCAYLTFLRVGYFALPRDPLKKYDYERNKNIGHVSFIYYTSR